MDLKKAKEIIKEWENESDISSLEEQIEEKKEEIETLSDEIAGLEQEIDIIREQENDEDSEVNKAYEVVDAACAEIKRIEEALKSGVVKNTHLVEKQLEEFRKQVYAKV